MAHWPLAPGSASEIRLPNLVYSVNGGRLNIWNGHTHIYSGPAYPTAPPVGPWHDAPPAFLPPPPVWVPSPLPQYHHHQLPALAQHTQLPPEIRRYRPLRPRVAAYQQHFYAQPSGHEQQPLYAPQPRQSALDAYPHTLPPSDHASEYVQTGPNRVMPRPSTASTTPFDDGPATRQAKARGHSDSAVNVEVVKVEEEESRSHKRGRAVIKTELEDDEEGVSRARIPKKIKTGLEEDKKFMKQQSFKGPRR